MSLYSIPCFIAQTVRIPQFIAALARNKQDQMLLQTPG